MPTELVTLSSQQAVLAGRESPLKGMKSVQAPTIRHDDMTFGDFVDMINPLHHIPIVSSFYQNATGDTISPVASLVGGGLLGGVFGFVGAAVNAIFQEATGESLVGSVANALLGGPEGQAATVTAAKKGADSYIDLATSPKTQQVASNLDMRI